MVWVALPEGAGAWGAAAAHPDPSLRGSNRAPAVGAGRPCTDMWSVSLLACGTGRVLHQEAGAPPDAAVPNGLG